MTTYQLIHEIWADKDLKAPAFIDDNKTYTYQEFDDYVLRYTKLLSDRGIGYGDTVGILLHNCVDYLISFFALSRLGAIMVPINYQFTDAEIDYIATDAKVAFIITSRNVHVSVPLVPFTSLREAADALPTVPTAPPCPAKESDIVAIIYTSGTTGSPKGAMSTHSNFIKNVSAFIDLFNFNENDRHLAVLPFYHCFGLIAASILTLITGASAYILKTFNPGEVVRTIATNKITVLIMVPTMYQLFARLKAVDAFGSVRLSIAGGAPLPKAIAEVYKEVYHQEIIEGYGLSEATAVVCANTPNKQKHYSIGLPLPNITIRIQKEDGSEALTGEIGELLVKGPNVMQGYLNKPEDTANVLKDGWLHTGDMAYRDAEGFVYIVDRMKDIIIINGENVYPREIENELYNHPDIAEVAVVGRQDPLRGEVVWAYLVMKEGKELDVSAIRSYLKGKVAPFKMPKGFSALDSLPKNATGKIVKRLLK